MDGSANFVVGDGGIERIHWTANWNQYLGVLERFATWVNDEHPDDAAQIWYPGTPGASIAPLDDQLAWLLAWRWQWSLESCGLIDAGSAEETTGWPGRASAGASAIWCDPETPRDAWAVTREAAALWTDYVTEYLADQEQHSAVSG